MSTPVQEDEEQEQEELICCCLCYCAVDYSDKSYFCQIARDADSDLEGEQPLLLPMELYDPNNALVFCDSCDRPYHQLCHFIPAIHLPRGDWNCFICSSAPKILEQQKKTKKQSKANNTSSSWTETQLKEHIYQMNQPAGQLELQWEYDVRTHKVLAFKAEMRRLQGGISVQMQNIRLAQMTLKAFTTSRRKTSVESMLKSQELCQALVKVSSAKLRVRQLLQSLEQYMKGDDDKWNILQQFLKQHESEVTTWFPLVQNAPRRLVPRLKDTYDDDNNKVVTGNVPQEVRMTKDNQSSDIQGAMTGAKSRANNSVKNTAKGNKPNNPKPNNDEDDDDSSGISLDDLKCAVCFKGDATDDNDLLMCDGQDCFRSHHMHCHAPIITECDAQNEEDWFCPLCKSLAKLVADVQSEYTGDEWYSEDAESVASWECANDVFPEAPEEHEMAMKWKQNKIDAEAKTYLKNLFGDHDHDQYEQDDSGQLGHLLEEDDDEEDDDDFDPNGTTKALDDEETDNDSDTSSKASLGELSIELKIGRQELDALSGGESSSNEDDDKIENGKNTRRSRRVRSTLSSRTASRTTTDDEKSNTDAVVDVGKLDESNIILGKRRRRKIDYALLNDSMFGGLSAEDRAKIDDEVEFQYKAPTRRDTSSDSDDDSNESGEASDASHNNNSSSGSNLGRDDNADNGDAHVRKVKKVVPAATEGTKKGNAVKKTIPRSGVVGKGRAGQKSLQSKNATSTDTPRKDKSEKTSGNEKKVMVPRKSKRSATVVATGKQRHPPVKRLKTRKR
ncbi:hypothetical protein MHU86_8264 [Fragilaria crotonensis]|nr:hypothetical protein MHU86_8264 [Fragilaria crotonensis]